MKSRITNKKVRNSWENIIVDGGHIQHLLSCRNAEFYACGVYGWNYDVYPIDSGTCICTGYRPIGNIKPDYKTVNEYEKKAAAICENTWLYDERRPQLDALLDEFVKEVTA